MNQVLSILIALTLPIAVHAEGENNDDGAQVAVRGGKGGDGKGGGVVTGDGYPLRTIPSHETEIPLELTLRQMISNIGQEFPTLAQKLNNLLGRFIETHAGGNPDIPQNDARFFVFEERGDTHYATSAHWVEKVKKPYGNWEFQRYRIFVWQRFEQLPLLAAEPGAPSQSKVILHEFLHLMLTGSDHDRAQALTEKLYKLATQGFGSLTLTELRELSAIIQLELDGTPVFDTFGGGFHEVLDYYKGWARPMRAACEDFTLSAPVRIAGDFYQFPMPPGWLVQRLGASPRIHVDPTEIQPVRDTDPFFRMYRTYCWRKTWEGLTLLGAESPTTDHGKIEPHPLFIHPKVIARLIRAVTGVIPALRLELTEWKHIQLVPTNYDQILPRMAEFFEEIHRPVSAARMEEILPGYRQWLELYKKSHAPEEGARTWTLHYFDNGYRDARFSNLTDEDEIVTHHHLGAWPIQWLGASIDPRSPRIQIASTQHRDGATIETQGGEVVCSVPDEYRPDVPPGGRHVRTPFVALECGYRSFGLFGSKGNWTQTEWVSWKNPFIRLEEENPEMVRSLRAYRGYGEIQGPRE